MEDLVHARDDDAVAQQEAAGRGGATRAASHPPRARRPDDEPISRSGDLTVPRNGIASWYLLAYSEELRSGQVVPRTLHGREIVLYRGRESGRAFALSAHCAHMGTHLEHGDVQGDEIRCALHHWRFDGASGTCTHASGCERPPGWARQRSFPVRERHGAVFVHNGPDPGFDIPTWDGSDDDRVLVGHAKPLHLPAHWVPLALNAFDGLHLGYVHHREVREPPQVSYPDSWSCRMSWHADVTGTHLSDRITRWAGHGDGVRAHITNHGGVLLLIESRVGRHTSRLMLGLDPQADGSVVVRGMFPVDRSRIPLLAQLRMRLQRRLFVRFLTPDVELFTHIRYRPRTPLPEGEPLQPALEFLARLPGAQ